MPKPDYKNYILILLTVVAAFNFLDRYVLSLVLESIKLDLELSDSQLGFLTGFAFALFYAVAGIPIARWADRGNRNIIISLTTGLWSVLVAICGLVTGYTQLLLVRVGVAVGESGCLPPAQSLIADYFNRAERPKAMATYWLCGPLSVILGYLGGGWLIEYFGWRLTFIIIGMPGIFLAILVRLTLREPRLHKKIPYSRTTPVQPPTFKEVFRTLVKLRSFVYITIAFCISYFFGMGLAQWMPTFFIRSYDMEVGELGTWLAIVWGLCSVVGTYLGGYLATRYLAQKEALQMRLAALVFVVCGLLYIFIYIVPTKQFAMALMAVIGVLFPMTSGAIFSAIQSLVDDRMRSVAIALLFLLANLIGLGLGPVAVGILSDLLTARFGSESLRYTLALFSPGYVLVALCYWKAATTIEQDIRQVEINNVSEDLQNHSNRESEVLLGNPKADATE